MAVWREEVVGRRRVVTAEKVSFTVAFFRERDESVWVMLTAGTAYKLDANRPPVLWIDEGPHFVAVACLVRQQAHHSSLQVPNRL